jgi:hypothetical protein
MMTPRKRGRPPLIQNRTKLSLYVTRQESRQIARAARAQRQSASAWLRELALAALAAPENADAR